MFLSTRDLLPLHYSHSLSKARHLKQPPHSGGDPMMAAASPCRCCAAHNLQPSDNGKLTQQAVGNLNLRGWEIITGSSGSQKRAGRLSLGHAHLHDPPPPGCSSSAGGFLSAAAAAASQWNYLHHFHLLLFIISNLVSLHCHVLHVPATVIWNPPHKRHYYVGLFIGKWLSKESAGWHCSAVKSTFFFFRPRREKYCHSVVTMEFLDVWVR